eukprot:620182-Hanusia_phi.AAC.3
MAMVDHGDLVIFPYSSNPSFVCALTQGGVSSKFTLLDRRPLPLLRPAVESSSLTTPPRTSSTTRLTLTTALTTSTTSPTASGASRS